MKKHLFVAALMVISVVSFAQKSKTRATGSSAVHIPLQAARWDAAAGSVEFTNHQGQPAMKLLNGEIVVLKDFVFGNGVIEYDIDPLDERFTGVDFRRQNAQETERVYLRTARAGNLVAMDAIQYSPFLKGVNLWDLLDHFQGPAPIRKNEWNHMKLVVSGKQMLVYMNDMSRPVLEIPQLEGNYMEGGIAFSGRCAIANLVINTDEVEGLPARAGFDPTHHDPRYIRAWQVNQPQMLPFGRELYEGEFPKLTTKWTDVTAERRGLINVTRFYGEDPQRSRRYVWLRTKLVTSTEQRRKISLGFSDDVWVFLNRQPLFVDKNNYVSPQMRKTPDGRISIENGQFELTLRAGENELLVGVANDFFGWGLVARLDNMDGIEVSTQFPPPIEPPKDMQVYAGTYSSADVNFKIIVTIVNSTLMAQATGEPAIAMEYFDRDKFRFEQAGIVLDFTPAEKKAVLKQGERLIAFTKE